MFIRKLLLNSRGSPPSDLFPCCEYYPSVFTAPTSTPFILMILINAICEKFRDAGWNGYEWSQQRDLVQRHLTNNSASVTKQFNSLEEWPLARRAKVPKEEITNFRS